MKKNPKKSSSRNPRTICSRNVFRLAGFAAGLSVLLSLAILFGIGLPPGLTVRITARLQEAGLPLHARSIRLSTHRGWVLNQARLYSPSPDDIKPLLSADKLYVSLRPDGWRNLFKNWRIGIYVRNATVSFGPLWESELPENHPFRTISKLKTSLTVGPERAAVKNLLLQWGNLTLAAQGDALFSADGAPRRDPPDDLRRQATDAALFLGKLKYDTPPRIEVDFYYDRSRPEMNRLDAALSAEGLRLNNHVYAKLSGTADGRGPSWTLRDLQLNRTEHEYLRLRGEFDADSTLAHLFIENTLPAAELLTLFPEKIQSAVEQTSLNLFGQTDFTGEIGPAPVCRLLDTASIQMRHMQVSYPPLTLDPLSFRLTRDNSRVRLEEIQGLSNGGPFTGWVEIDLLTEAWSAEAQTRCDPEPICALIDEDLHDFVKRFHFPEGPPQTDLVLSQAGDGEPVFVSGTLSGERFTCGGVFIERLDALMVYSNNVLDLSPLQVRRGEERFDGSIQVDFPRDLAFFNAASSFPPSDIAHAVAPGTKTILDRIRVSGPVYAAGSGQIDYGSETNHAFSGTFRAEKVRLDGIEADLFDTTIEGRGTQLLFTRSAAQIYKGFAEGSAAFDLLPEDGSAPYSLSTRFSQIDLEHMLQATGGSYGRTRGQLSGELDFSADGASGFWESVQGRGQVSVQNGHLADLPLFGGFSRLIQSAFPAFSLFSLTTFYADYELRDNAVWSSNAQFGGTLLSARARGNYSPESGLDFLVVVQPLRQTGGEDSAWYQLHHWAVHVLKRGSSPFFKLLELSLKGPVSQPEWHLVNLPKEVSELLRRPKSDSEE